MAGRTCHCDTGGRGGEHTRLAHVKGQRRGAEWVPFQQAPVTLEDMAAYLSQEEWQRPDPTPRDCSWDVLPEKRGNVREATGPCSSMACLTWTSLAVGEGVAPS